MLIDPTQRLCAQDYYFDLNRRTGLHPQDITHCFCTHEHFDHQVGLNYFRNTIWLAAEPVAEKLLNSVYINGKKYRELKESFYLELRRFGCRDTQRQYMEFHFGIRADMY